MHPSFHIRKIEKRDCPRIMELIQELADFEKAPNEVTVSLSHLEETGFGAQPIWWGFVAETESNGQPEVVGFALYYIRYSTWKGASMYLEDLLVTQKWRQHGIGQLLLDAIIAEAKAKELVQIRWQVLEWNTPAIEFYKKNKAELDAEWINCTVSL